MIFIGSQTEVFGAKIDPIITEFSTDKNSYTEGDTIVITGHIDNHWSNHTATLNVNVANGGSQPPFKTSIDSNGDFQTQITAGGPEWSREGTYGLRVIHVAGSFTAYTTFEYTPPALDEIQITQDTFITTDKREYTYDEKIIVSGNIGDLQFPITIEKRCDLLPTPSGYLKLNAFGTASYEVKPDGSFELDYGAIGCYGQTSTSRLVIQGTDIETIFQMIGEEPQSDPEIPPATTILSFSSCNTYDTWSKTRIRIFTSWYTCSRWNCYINIRRSRFRSWFWSR